LSTQSPCPFLLLQTSCTSDGTSCTPSPPDTTPPATGSPLSQLAACVSDRATPAAGCVDTIAANEGDILDYRIDYTNAGTATAHSVTITDVIPAGMTFQSDSCTPPDVTGATCTYDGPSRTLTITLGDVAPDTTLSTTFTTLNGTCPVAGGSNVANGQSKEEAAFSSNSADVTTGCIA
jgi:uncharacterized repeat protein (TIGR01451 family)